jgi:acyl-CoA synthetase (AMP-forming)/AMP-acid ligase II
MVKRRGYRVELGEIESVLYQHSALTQVAAVAVPDENQGVRVEAFVVAERAAPSIVELKVFCSENLPGYMVPDGFQFLEELPTTSTGKTDYQGLLSSLRG